MSSRLTLSRRLRPAASFIAVLLFVDFVDEFVSGLPGAALPQIRADLGLSYAQVGLFLALFGSASLLLEPIFGVLSDIWPRRPMIVAGALLGGVAWLMLGTANDIAKVFVAVALENVGLSLFVPLSQATLMDARPDDRERMMTRWTLMGGIGDLVGPLLVSAAFAAAIGWRPLFLVAGGFVLCFAVVLWRQPFPRRPAHLEGEPLPTWRDLVAVARDPLLLRLVVLEFLGGHMDETFFGMTALFLVDVGGISPAAASLALSVLHAAALVGLVALDRLLGRIPSLRLLKVTGVIGLAAYATFLLAPSWPLRFALLPVVGFCSAMWYPLTKAQLFAVRPGQSGTVLAVSSLMGWVEAGVPAALGVIAGAWGLIWAMAWFLVSPLGMLALLPRTDEGRKTKDE